MSKKYLYVKSIKEAVQLGADKGLDNLMAISEDRGTIATYFSMRIDIG